jgi:hypothetical protein
VLARRYCAVAVSLGMAQGGLPAHQLRELVNPMKTRKNLNYSSNLNFN